MPEPGAAARQGDVREDVALVGLVVFAGGGVQQMAGADLGDPLVQDSQPIQATHRLHG